MSLLPSFTLLFTTTSDKPQVFSFSFNGGFNFFLDSKRRLLDTFGSF